MLSLADRLRLVRTLARGGVGVVAALTAVLLVAGLIPTGVAVTLAAFIAPLLFAARSRIDGWHRARVTRTAAGCDRVDVLEQPDVQVLVRVALADRTRGFDSTPADGALGQLRWATTMVGAA